MDFYLSCVCCLRIHLHYSSKCWNISWLHKHRSVTPVIVKSYSPQKELSIEHSESLYFVSLNYLPVHYFLTFSLGICSGMLMEVLSSSFIWSILLLCYGGRVQTCHTFIGRIKYLGSYLPLKSTV